MVDLLGNIRDLLVPTIAKLSDEVKTPIRCSIDYDQRVIVLKPEGGEGISLKSAPIS